MKTKVLPQLKAKAVLAAALFVGCAVMPAFLPGSNALGEPLLPGNELAAQKQPDAKPKTDALGDPLPPGAVARLGTRRFQVWTHPHEPISVAGGKAYLTYQPDFSGWGKGAAYQWMDAETGKLIESWPLPDGLTGLGVSADGKWAVLTNRGINWRQGDDMSFTLHLYDLTRKQEVKAIKGEFEALLRGAAQFNAAFISADGKWLVTKAYHTVELWDATTGKKVWINPLDEYGNRVLLRILGFTSGDGQLVVGHLRNDLITVLLVDAKQGKIVRTFPAADRAVWEWESGNIGLSPDGHALVVGSKSSGFRVWEVKTGKELPRLIGHKEGPGYFAFAPDSRTLVTASPKETSVLVRDWPSGKVRREILLGRTGLAKLFISADGRILNVLFEAGPATYHLAPPETALYRYDLETGKALPISDSHQAAVLGVVAAPDGTIRSIGEDRVLRSWDLPTGKQTRQTRIADMPRQEAWSVWQPTLNRPDLTLSPDGKFVAAPDRGRNAILLFGEGADKPLRTIKTESRDCLTFSADGRWLASSGFADDVSVWEVATGKEIVNFRDERPVRVAASNIAISAFSPDNRFLAAIFMRQLHIWNANGWKLVDKVSLGDPNTFQGSALTFSGDGRMLGVATWSVESKGGRIGNTSMSWNQIILVETLTRKVRAKLNIEGIPSTGPQFSPDGRFLAWGTTKATAEVWDVLRGQRVAAFQGHDGPVRALTFTRDSKHLVTASVDGTLLVWDVAGIGSK